MARICKLTGKRPVTGGSITRSGKAKKEGGIGRHVKKVVKRKFYPNLQRVKIIDENGTVKYVRVAASAIKKGLITKAPKRNWKPEAAEAK
ncbi:MAG: 50S ribosomal protein L28 [Verrucomicrobiales bacterium]|nr:50S ribosomal protein L28 [Verrucomicrobiales bacterium]MBO60730.1 50S ribosomal protein L28 [Verrucomicrobiales bacterium]|tara:strand:+ start:302 stop:571 length:270 start_codon:yes stop_codon:yes gene_type:complete